MRISSLKYFYEVAELKSISKVSNNLHISQPALSHQLSKLEKELGVKLFERSNRGVELTDKGKLLYGYAKEIINLHNNLIDELSDEDNGEKEVRINILSRYGNFLIDQIAKDMSSIFNGVNVSISNELEVNEKSLLLHNRADILIGRNKIIDNDLISEYIGRDKLILVSDGYLECAMASDLSVALLEDSLRQEVSSNLLTSNKNIFLKTDSIDVIKSYLKNNKTAAIVPSIAVKKELYKGKLNRLCSERYDVEYELYITYRKDRSVKFKKKLRTLKNELEKVLSKDKVDIVI